MTTANRVIKNTGFLYAKMGITMFISLYTTRLILNSLGASDFGIFTLIGGAIAMLGFLNGALAGATQRFMSFYQGKGDKEKQKQIFNISIVLHFVVALFLGIILVIVGYFLFNGVLNIPSDRIDAAKVVFGSLIISTMFTVMSVPYDAVLNAHENMLYYSIVGLIETFLKLGVAFAVVHYLGDKLEIYGVLMACIPFVTLSIMRVYCHMKYEECKITIGKYWNVSLLKEMTGFAGWNFLGISVSMLTNYGQGIILNTFFGTTINAAQGIASQVFGQLSVFSNNMLKAINPVIVKSKGGSDHKLFKQATFIAIKTGFFLMAIFVVPFIFETRYIFKIWLGDIPEYAIIFSQLLLTRELINQLFNPLKTAIDSTGNIKEYKILSSILYLLILILAYLSFQSGYSPVSMYYIFIIIEFVRNFCLILYFAKTKSNLNPFFFFKEILFKILLIISVSVTITYGVFNFIIEGFIRLFFVFFTFGISYTSLFYLFSLNSNEKSQIRDVVKKMKDQIMKIIIKENKQMPEISS